VAQAIGTLEQQVPHDQMAYRGFLEALLKKEAAGSTARKQSTMTRLSGSPAVKTLDEFTFKFGKGVKRSQIEELAGLDFVERSENIVLVGPNCAGKPRLVIELGYHQATQADLKTRFITAAGLLLPELLREMPVRGGFAFFLSPSCGRAWPWPTMVIGRHFPKSPQAEAAKAQRMLDPSIRSLDDGFAPSIGILD
jgi:hypothetical protein